MIMLNMGEAIVPSLIEFLGDTSATDTFVMNLWRKKCKKMLATIGDKAIPYLIENLTNEDRNIRSQVATILDEIGYETTDGEARISYLYATENVAGLQAAGGQAIPLTVAVCLVTRFTEASTKRTAVMAARPNGSS